MCLPEAPLIEREFANEIKKIPTLKPAVGLKGQRQSGAIPYHVWLAIAGHFDGAARSRQLIASKVSVLKGSRVVFIIKGNDYRWLQPLNSGGSSGDPILRNTRRVRQNRRGDSAEPNGRTRQPIKSGSLGHSVSPAAVLTIQARSKETAGVVPTYDPRLRRCVF